MSRIIRMLFVAFALSLVLAPSQADAAGYENIAGAAGFQVYMTPRYVTNPASPGAEVAFIQYAGLDLMLGAHDCNGGYISSYPQAMNSWRTVLVTGVPMKFCLKSNSGASWNGDLNWD